MCGKCDRYFVVLGVRSRLGDVEEVRSLFWVLEGAITFWGCWGAIAQALNHDDCKASC
ncbi:MAG: hypothetical protein VKN72_18280 [Nostocales cyanobacterium 94392]|nr:hypothetical protein [Nostocales cyanobacterium 94392]